LNMVTALLPIPVGNFIVPVQLAVLLTYGKVEDCCRL